MLRDFKGSIMVLSVLKVKTGSNKCFEVHLNFLMDSTNHYNRSCR